MSILHFNFSKLFDWQYLAEDAPARLAHSTSLTIFFGAIFVLSAVSYFILAKKKLPRFLKRFYYWIVYTGLYGSVYFLFLIFSRTQGLNFFKLRSVFIISVVLVLIWLIFLLIYRIIIVSRLIDQYKVYKRKEKYLHGKSSKR